MRLWSIKDLLNLIETRLKPRGTDSISANELRAVLRAMVRFTSQVEEEIKEIPINEQNLYYVLIKYPGNILPTAEDGDWELRVEEGTKNFQKRKRKNGVWELVEEDTYA